GGFQLLRRWEQQVRFAVHGPGNPVASPRSHGVPRRDADGRVHVSVAGETAGRADEARLALARLRIHVPARRAPLARIMRLDLLHPAGRLVLQTADQQAPARGEDAPVQPGLLAYVPAGCFGGSSSRAGHARDVKVLDPDGIEPACQVRAGLLGPVLSPVPLAGRQPGDRILDAPAAVRAAPGAGEPALQAPQAVPFRAAQPGNVEQFTGGQGGGDGHAAVDADGLAVAGRGDRSGDRREGDVPPPGPVQGHPVGLDSRRHRTGPAEPYPSGLRDPHLAGMAGQAAYVAELDSDDPESLVAAGLAPRRAVMGAADVVRG